ncbi:uncharacterized protein LOC110025257 [Phalaenopsis equestris]|uniref:uncharacterized protein LOC110025257 n=1 Tax=Phalaenopsis equestris TaxID=78828 RepID=UPI0009E5C24A|nr:uncharacterized protein LOC110025257 [Phalaenopsis equestris]
MASCDDDFPILGDEAQSHHPQAQQQQMRASASMAAGGAAASVLSFPANRYLSEVTVPIHSRSGPFDGKKISTGSVGDDEDHDGYGEAFASTDVNPHSHCFADDDPVPDPFDPLQPRQNEGSSGDDSSDHKSRAAAASVSHFNYPHQRLLAPLAEARRRDRDELSDEEGPFGYNTGNKRSRSSSVAPSSSSDYRKDREEWSDSAIGCLLDAFTEKYVLLNRGNLRGRDWEDVATTVSEGCDKQKSGKTVEQCKNKVDNLKKRYKVECQRLCSGSIAVSHWLWFKKMELIVGSSSKNAVGDDKAPALGDSSPVSRQMKRYPGTSPGSASLTSNIKLKSLPNPRWKRVVLKISGAALAGTGSQNVDPKVMMLIANEVAMANNVGVEVAVVAGGLNFFCGDSLVAATDTDRTTACQIGIMASTMNAILLQASLEKIGIETRVQTPFMMQEIADLYIRRRAIRHLEKGRIVIFGGIGFGTGNPLVTTDAAAALRASEINADAVLKGIISDDVNGSHSRNGSSGFEHISFRDFVSRGFTSMDVTAVSFCEESNISVVLFNLLEPGNISRALCGDQVGILIDQLGIVS